MSDDWLEKIQGMLDDSLGSQEKKAEAYRAAMEVDAALGLYPPTHSAQATAAIIRRWVEQAIEHMRYLLNPPTLDHVLPESLMRSDAEVAHEYGLKTQRGVEERQRQIANASETRVARALDHLAAGWPLEDCISFVASKAEWRQVLRRARETAA